MREQLQIVIDKVVLEVKHKYQKQVQKLKTDSLIDGYEQRKYIIKKEGVLRGTARKYNNINNTRGTTLGEPKNI